MIFYSHRGTCAYVARQFFYSLKKEGRAEIFELKYVGTRGIFTRFLYRFNLSWVRINTVPVDLKDYDALILGISVLGGFPSPALSKYISLLENIAGKRIVCVYVYGIEISAEGCIRYVHRLLQTKGLPQQIIDVEIPWYNVLRKDFLDKQIEEAISKLKENRAP